MEIEEIRKDIRALIRLTARTITANPNEIEGLIIWAYGKSEISTQDPAETAGTTDPELPFQSPFSLSSMERELCRTGVKTKVEIKRYHLAENLKVVGRRIGMDSAMQQEFLNWWCSPNQRDKSEIRAESDPYFNLTDRATNWLNKRKAQSPQSRAEQYQQASINFNELADGIFRSTNVPGAEHRPTDSPDEQ